MSRRFTTILTTIIFLFLSISSYAQEGGAFGAYSPYTIYGIGDLCNGGVSHNRSMGGVGTAMRNRRFINITNPAAVTARDTLAFMADFGIFQSNKVLKQNINGNKIRSANNTFNITDVVLSFPIWKSSAFMIGITPFSDLGYSYNSVVTDPSIIGHTNTVTYNSYGEGGLYEIFLAAGATFFKRFSVGAQLNYYFGSFSKAANMNYADETIRDISSGHDVSLRGVTGKFGLQYEQKLKDDYYMSLGLTYRMKTNMKGYSETYRYATASNIVDTLTNYTDTIGRKASNKVSLGDEIGVGIGFGQKDRWHLEFDYLRSGWGNSGFDDVNGFKASSDKFQFTSTSTNTYRMGFEITPNRNDVRYYLRRVTYRIGVYHENMYYKLDGNRVSASGITLGFTLPVYRWYNGITFGIDFGSKGNMKPTSDPTRSMIRENYCTFNIGFNIHDIWFKKPRYE